MASNRTMVDSPTLGSRSMDSRIEILPSPHQAKEINFSRPKVDRDQDSSIRRSETFKATTRIHDSHRNAFANDPRFSHERNDSVSSISTRSIGSDLTWDTDRGELVSRRKLNPKLSTEQHLRVRQPASRPPNPRSNSSSTLNTSRPGTQDSAAGSVTKPPLRGILKKTEVSIQSASENGEETSSHRTGSSETGSTGSTWTSSEYDTSSMSEKEIKKLEKKGINPALYAEMNAARGGRRRFGTLAGNSFVS